jgi:GNAT superfamily N-acetyltransferase
VGSDELLRIVCDTLDGYLALGNEVRDDPDVRFVRNPEALRIWDANHGSRVRARSRREIDRVFARADEAFAHLPHRRWMCDPLTPAEFEARLVLDDYRVDTELQLLLEGNLRADAPEIDVRPVETDGEWEAVARLTRLDHEEGAVKFARPVYEKSVTRQMVAIRRAKCPPLRFFLARADDVDCAFFSSWPGENGVGKVEDLFTHPDFRGRGIATALIVRCVLDARERGAGPVVIAALPNDTPKQLYERLGFRPFCVTRGYLKTESDLV